MARNEAEATRTRNEAIAGATDNFNQEMAAARLPPGHDASKENLKKTNFSRLPGSADLVDPVTRRKV